MYSVENTSKEIADSGVEIAILSFGAIEQHGHHMPLGTDWYLGEAMAKRLGEELGAYVLPTMPFGCSREHMDCPGTITLRPTTLAAVLEDLVESLYQHGIRKIVMLSSHGGNWALKPFMRELNFKYKDLTLIWANGPLPERGEEVPVDIHAGKGETSRLMHVRPELVKEATEEDDSPGFVGQEFVDYVGFSGATKRGAWGKPSDASPEFGQEEFEEAVHRQAEYVRWAFEKIEEINREEDS